MKKAKTSNQKEEITDKDPELQAIILADNYSNKFWPITLEGPLVIYLGYSFVSKFGLGFDSFGQHYTDRLYYSIPSHK
jgi:hypothetical protein